ncbi:MAG: glycosyltransferase family 39 protein, partial [Anaerolineae bacterium]|nr:glycosyltransferase family 39 protein [Anaerolineae bacterium]
MKPSSKGTPLKVLLPLVLVLLVAAVLRWAALPEMSDMLNFDESFYAIDALSLLESPRFTPFFEGNTGRQSAWMYILALFFLGLGPTPFAARLAATFVSLLTVAAAYQLGRALLGRVAAVGAAAAMATLYLPVHFGHIAFRANLLPLLGALSLVFLLAAIRRGRLAFWVATGVTLGLMSYSYISAY